MSEYKKKHWNTKRKKHDYPKWENTLHPNAKDLTGLTFGYLKVNKPDFERTGKGRVYWICECSRCGNIISKMGKALTNGSTKSCGCLRIDISKQNLRPWIPTKKES